MKFDVVTIGSAVLDVLLQSSGFTVAPVNNQLMVCEIYGGKMDVDQAIVTSGGAATNTAVSFARQGFSVACIAKVGVDVAAQVVWDDLHREGVRTRLLAQDQTQRTGISSVLVASDGSRSAMTFRGGSHDLLISDVHFDKLEGVRAIHLSNVGNIELIGKVSDYCRTHGVFLSWNPGKTEAEEILLRQRRENEKLCDVLFLNDQEWDAVRKNEAGIKRSVRTLIITRGKEGGEVFRDGVPTSYRATKTNAVDETGAGDAFAAGFVGAHLRGETLDQALAFAVENATSVVGYMGAKEGLLRK